MNAVSLAPRFEGDIQSVTEPERETGDPEIVLRLLSSIERDSAITQRKLAGHLGIALGLANAYLRRCIRKGFVKVTRVPLNRYAYYLTPQGFVEKSRLTADYFSASLNFFRRAARRLQSAPGTVRHRRLEPRSAVWRRRSGGDRNAERR